METVRTFLFVVLILFPFVDCFLLDSGQSGHSILNSSNSNQFVSLAEFQEETKTLQHSMDRSLNVLTYQLQQKLNAFEQQLQASEKDNSTFKILEQNYHALKAELENTKFNYSELKSENEHLKKELANLKDKQDFIRNNTVQNANDIGNLKNLQSIKPLEDIKSLQKIVQNISTETRSLAISESARRQDFLALYNMTLNLEKSTEQFKGKTNVSMEDILRMINNNTQAFEDYEELNKRRQIGFSAYRNNSYYQSNGPVIFDKIWTNRGNAYDPKTGVFTAPHAGLYHVSAVVMSPNSETLYFHIYHNNEKRSGSYLDFNGYKAWTLDLVLDMSDGDRAYVKSESYLFSNSALYVTFSGHLVF